MMVHPILGVPAGTIPDEGIRKGGSTGRIGYFGMTRNGGDKMHAGVDLICGVGAPVYAAHAGRVMQAGWQNGGEGKPGAGYGLRVYLADSTTTSVYAHLCHLLVQQGDELEAGQLIGFAGWTGNADPRDVHVHFEIRRGDPVDPVEEFEKIADAERHPPIKGV